LYLIKLNKDLIMATVSFNVTRSSDPNTAEVTIPRAFEKDGEFYDLHIVLTGDLATLKDRVASISKPLAKQMGDCLAFCAANNGGELTDYVVTQDSSNTIAVQKNKTPMPVVASRVKAQADPIFTKLRNLATSSAGSRIAPPLETGSGGSKWLKRGGAAVVGAALTAGACYAYPPLGAAVLAGGTQAASVVSSAASSAATAVSTHGPTIAAGALGVGTTVVNYVRPWWEMIRDKIPFLKS
jgi:hypothetical protein